MRPLPPLAAIPPFTFDWGDTPPPPFLCFTFSSSFKMVFSFSYPDSPYSKATTSVIDISRVIISGPQPPNTTYRIFPVSLPSGLLFDASSGLISGTTNFTSISPATTYTVDASYATAVATTTLVLSINFTPVFSYPQSPDIFAINKILNIIPSYLISNIEGIFYTLISPAALPAGLSLDTAFGIISGAPTVLSNLTTYTIRANNGGVIYDASLNISIQNTPTIGYSDATYILTQSQPVNILPLATTSQSQITYSITGCAYTDVPYNLPFGLTFNTSTGAITGVPTVLTTFRTYLITVSNIIGSASTTLTLDVIKEFLSPPVVADNFSSDSLITDPTIAMRRKAEILKYKNNSSNLSKQQYYSLLAQGKGPYAKRALGNQGNMNTNPNISGLPLVGNTLVCNVSNIICSPTSSSDVPGPVMNLCYNPAIPLIGYNAPNRKKVNIGIKWPQSTWRTGDNGFPIGKAGSG